LPRAAESVASGDLAALAGVLPTPPADAPRTAQRALAHGTGWVMAYGGLSAWILAAASFVVFRKRSAIDQDKKKRAKGTWQINFSSGSQFN
jgi:hypothetical protein